MEMDFIMRYSRVLHYFVALVAGSYAGSVFAVELVATVGQGVEVTDNIHDTENKKSSEIISTTTLVTEATHRSQVLDLTLNYEMSHLRHKQGHLDNTNTVVGAGNVTWYIVPGRIQWFVSEIENYSIVDRRLADSTDNRAQSSSWSTGPKVNVPIGQVDSATFDAVYTQSSNDSNENDDANNDDAVDDNKSIVSSGSVGWSHLLSETKRFSIKYSKSKTNFEDNANNTKSSGIEGTLNAQTASGSFVVGIGTTRFDIDSGDSTRADSFELQYTKRWSSSVVSISAQKELTDTVSIFQDQEQSQSLPFEDAVIRTTFDASYSRPIFGALTTLDMSTSYQEEEFQTLENMQRIKTFDIGVTHRLVEHISLFTTYNYQWTQFDFIDIKRIDREHTLSLGGDYRVNKELTFTLSATADVRQVGSEASTDHSNVSKNSLALAVDYQFL